MWVFRQGHCVPSSSQVNPSQREQGCNDCNVFRRLNKVLNDSATLVLSLIPLVYLLVLWWFPLSARRDEPDSASATCAVRSGHSLLSPTHSQQCTHVNFWVVLHTEPSHAFN